MQFITILDFITWNIPRTLVNFLPSRCSTLPCPGSREESKVHMWDTYQMHTVGLVWTIIDQKNLSKKQAWPHSQAFPPSNFWLLPVCKNRGGGMASSCVWRQCLPGYTPAEKTERVLLRPFIAVLIQILGSWIFMEAKRVLFVVQDQEHMSPPHPQDVTSCHLW